MGFVISNSQLSLLKSSIISPLAPSAAVFPSFTLKDHHSAASMAIATSKTDQGMVTADAPYVPVYVTLPEGIIDMNSEVVEIEELESQLRTLKYIMVDGVMVDCWWGIVESNAPLQYNWSGYRTLFDLVRQLELKLQVSMSFHACDNDGINISLPKWVLDVGNENPDIFFTSRNGAMNQEYLSWGIDSERVLNGRTAVEVYTDFMKEFRKEFHNLFVDGSISEVGISLGPCGELRYPLYSWIAPKSPVCSMKEPKLPMDNFKCYDKYMMAAWTRHAGDYGKNEWAAPPYHFCSKPNDPAFCKFFLEWYSDRLVYHADQVLAQAKKIFWETPIAAKVRSTDMWTETHNHGLALTGGIYSRKDYRKGYAANPILGPFKSHNTIINLTRFAMVGMILFSRLHDDAWDLGLKVAAENRRPLFDASDYNQILWTGIKSRYHKDGSHLVRFTYERLCPTLLEENNFVVFSIFVRKMHGAARR